PSSPGEHSDRACVPTRRSSDLFHGCAAASDTVVAIHELAPPRRCHSNVQTGANASEGATMTTIIAGRFGQQDAVQDAISALARADRKSTRLNSSHVKTSNAVCC